MSSRGKRARWHAETNYGNYAPLSSRGGGPDDIWRQIMVICTFCHAEATSPITCKEIMVIRTTFRHPEMIESNGTQRQIMVILHLLSSRGGEPEDLWRQIMVIRTPFCHPGTTKSFTCGNFMVTRDSRQPRGAKLVSYPNFVRGPLLDDMRPFFGPCEVLGTHH